jgi:hypothetical protein
MASTRGAAPMPHPRAIRYHALDAAEIDMRRRSSSTGTTGSLTGG